MTPKGLQFRYLEKHELAPRTKAGITFSTLTIDVPVYLNWLLSRFLSLGGRTIRASVSHISQVLEGAYSRAPDALIICTGLGTRTLGGVEDKDMYPIRGQTVLVRAPWIKYGRTCSSADGLWTYIIPRRSGDVCVYISISSHLIFCSNITLYRWLLVEQRLKTIGG